MPMTIDQAREFVQMNCDLYTDETYTPHTDCMTIGDVQFEPTAEIRRKRWSHGDYRDFDDVIEAIARLIVRAQEESK